MSDLDSWSKEYDEKVAPKRAPSKPVLQQIAEYVVKHPQLNKAVESLANNRATSSINKGVGKVAEYTNPWVAGALQEAGDVGASVGNFALKPVNAAFGTKHNIPHPNMRQYVPEGLYNDVAFLGGQLGTGLVGLGGLGTGKGLVQAAQKLPRSSGTSGLIGDIIKGMGGGYVTGENEEGSRTLGTILGGVAQPLSSITNRGITNRVLSDKAQQEAKHTGKYADIFNPAKEKNLPYEPENLFAMGEEKLLDTFGRLRDRLGKDYREVIDKFLDDPSLDTAQKLQSELGTFIRNVEKNPKFKTDSLPPGLRKAYEAANEMRGTLKKDIEGSLRKGGLPEEAAQYPQTTKSFAKNVAPYKTVAISDVEQGIKHPEKLAKRLREDEKFMIELGHKYPELALNKLLPWLSGGGAAGSALLAALMGYSKGSHAATKKEPWLVTADGQEIYD